MVLYIDETETEEYFIVAGLLTESQQVVDNAYKRFKKSVSNIPLSNNLKQKLFLEFKSTLIDRQFQNIKKKMLIQICSIDGEMFYSYYLKKHKTMKQKLKESVYITLLSNIINSVEKSVIVVFDSFNKLDFDNNIISIFSRCENVIRVEPYDSQLNPGLQFADNLCSVIRLHLTDQDKSCFYHIIEKNVHEV